MEKPFDLLDPNYMNKVFHKLGDLAVSSRLPRLFRDVKVSPPVERSNPGKILKFLADVIARNHLNEYLPFVVKIANLIHPPIQDQKIGNQFSPRRATPDEYKCVECFA
jgi:hypothetical protein